MATENLDEFHAAVSDVVSSLDSLIALYTSQLEEYERLSANYIMTCIGFGGVVFGIIITLFGFRKKKKMDSARETDAELLNINRVISLLFLTIPSITTLFLYILSMQCRKVAIYRGYLWYLEDELGKRIDIPIRFDGTIIRKFLGGEGALRLFSSECFLTNRIGPAVMVFFAVIMILFSFLFSYYFANTQLERKGKFYRFYIITFGLLVVVCVVFSIICLYDLCVNEAVLQKVHEYCVNAAVGS